MNPPCARCKKTVYPVEKLNCLDKIWHKGCFKCETCGLSLTMKNYKGYNKLPYCNAHYPSTKFTAVADTPENMRLKKNTNQQSNVVYHKDFEDSKGVYVGATEDQRQAPQAQAQMPHSGYDRGPGSAPQQAAPPQHHIPEPEPAAPPPAAAHGGKKYVALYDYAAADEDEVSFMEGDVIINAEIIDDGWMQGTVQRTGESGMLPSNYVE